MGYVSLDYYNTVLMLTIDPILDKASPATKRNRVPWRRIADEPHMFYDDDMFKLPCHLKPVVDSVKDPVDLHMLVRYFRELQKQGNFFVFYQQNEYPSDASDDEADFDTPAVVTKRAARKKSPSRLVEQPPTPLTSEASNTVPIASAAPLAPVTAAVTTQHANKVTKPTDKSAMLSTTEMSSSGSEKSSVPAQPISRPTAKPSPVMLAARTSTTTMSAVGNKFPMPATAAATPPDGNQLHKATDQPPTHSTSEASRNESTASAVPTQTVNRSVTSADPFPGTSTTTTPVVGDETVTPTAPNTKKRKRRAARTEPQVIRDLRPRGKPVDVPPAEPPKKRKKVKANSWRKTKTGRLIPYYENSDYESDKEDAGPSQSNDSAKPVPPSNTESHPVEPAQAMSTL